MAIFEGLVGAPIAEEEILSDIVNVAHNKRMILYVSHRLDVYKRQRLVGMALGAALTCFVFYRNHKNRTYKRNLKDLIQEFDITSSRTKWQICQILCCLLYTSSKIANTFASERQMTYANKTISKHIDHLTDAFLISKASRCLLYTSRCV